MRDSILTMGYENDPITLTFSLAIFEKYGKDYKPALDIVLKNNEHLDNVYLTGAGPDWVSFVKGNRVYMVPSISIITVTVRK